MEKIILLGGGGHARVVIDTILEQKRYELVGVLDAAITLGSEVFPGVRVLGSDQDLQKYFAQGVRHTFVAFAAMENIQAREMAVRRAREIGFWFPVLIHPKTIISHQTTIGEGTFIAAGAILQPGTSIGAHSIINTGAQVDHDGKIGAYCHIAPGAVLSGNVTVHNYTHIGTGSCVIESRTIGERTFIGAGSVVVDDIPANCKAFGNPCRVRK
ncbi:MAG: hypothetical protein A3C46_05755 [Deltaproteobacteria bacterium RIFCSPHIGHO2_02_FULL_44_16]|nr:MAG: hypothetical protein A3C46_05755 [Deltaproteobacteria bacterium RIFCSPHIGHO2_02_FULL_44_16]